jgi:membrane-bound lytic murein transglycosylase D
MDPKDIGFPDREADTIADGLRREDVEAAELSAEHGTPTIMAELGDDGKPRFFDGAFRIGRGKDCELRVTADGVSREHCEVYWEDEQWRVRDLGSTNGTWLEGTRVETAPLRGRNALRLGRSGPVVWLKTGDTATRSDNQPDLDPYVERYVKGGWTDEVSSHTLMVRKAFDVTHRRQRVRHFLTLSVVAVVAIVAMTAVWRWRAAQVATARNTASDIFYSMKDLELRLARLENRLGGVAPESKQLESGRERLGTLSSSYDRYLKELDLIGEETPEQVVLILRMARVFGECEIDMPPSLVGEVNRYIDRWRNGTRFEKAVKRAQQGGFAGRVATAFDRVHLPPQYYYVALQESDFRVDVCGPETRYGIAKGAWQFIPGTGRAYGLHIGPLYLEPRHDPEDERHDFDRASDAAARYIRDIYLREAQGSGLLVLAIYNYGGTNVRRLIRSLPESPRERNFWQVLLEHRDRFPKETYDYVLNVFSAAVIGENPKLFGFDFAPPLADARIPVS